MMRWAKGCWIVVLGLLWALRLDLYLHSPHAEGDFATYLAAAYALRMNPHTNIYHLQALLPYDVHGLIQVSQTPYIYPPIFAIALEPLTLLPASWAIALWIGMNLVLWLIALLLLLAYLPKYRLLLFPLGLFYLPLWANLYYGQVNGLILVGVIMALWLVEHRHERWAGVILGILAAIKLFPLLLIGYLLIRRRWHVGIGAGMVLFGTSLITLAITGWGSVLAYLASLAEFSTITQHYALNLSLDGHVPFFLLGALLMVVIFAGAAARYQDASLRSGYAWGLVLMVLVLPLVWEHYFVWVLPVFVWLIVGRRSAVILAAIYLPLALIQTPTWLITVDLIPLYLMCGYHFCASSAQARKEAKIALVMVTSGVRHVRKKLLVGGISSEPEVR